MMDTQARTDKLHPRSNRAYEVSRLEARETNEDIREALKSSSASSYVFAVQGYEWEQS